MEVRSGWSSNKLFMKYVNFKAVAEGTTVTTGPGMATGILILSVKITFLKKDRINMVRTFINIAG